MPLLYGDPDADRRQRGRCPMHPDGRDAHEPADVPGVRHEAHPAAPSAWTCPMHPEVREREPGTCPECGMKLIPAGPTPPPALRHTDDHTHDIARRSRVGRPHAGDQPASNSRNMIWKLVDRDTGKENWEIDWAFRVGDQVKIRLVNDMDQDHPMHHPFHIHGAGRFLVLARDGEPDDEPRVEGHRPRALRRDRRHPSRRHQPGLVDGALPHRRTQPERHDVQLPRDRTGAGPMNAGPTGSLLDVLVIGGGQAGLVMGYHLAQSGRSFQIVDAGAEIGGTWRSRWDSLLLFTSGWYDNLPGLPFPLRRIPIRARTTSRTTFRPTPQSSSCRCGSARM